MVTDCCPLPPCPTAQFHDGYVDNYTAQIRASKFCLSPYGYGWGIRTSIYMAHGCVPVVLQDHVWQVGPRLWQALRCTILMLHTSAGSAGC